MAVYFRDNCPCLMGMHSYHSEAISEKNMTNLEQCWIDCPLEGL